MMHIGTFLVKPLIIIHFFVMSLILLSLCYLKFIFPFLMYSFLLFSYVIFPHFWHFLVPSYEDYLVDNYYLANGIDTNIVTAQDVLIEMQIATQNSDSPDF